MSKYAAGIAVLILWKGRDPYAAAGASDLRHRLAPATEAADVGLVAAGELVASPLSHGFREAAYHTGPRVSIREKGHVAHAFVAFIVFVLLVAHALPRGGGFLEGDGGAVVECG